MSISGCFRTYLNCWIQWTLWHSEDPHIYVSSHELQLSLHTACVPISYTTFSWRKTAILYWNNYETCLTAAEIKKVLPRSCLQMPTMWNNDEDGKKPPHHPSMPESTEIGGTVLMEDCQIKCRLVHSQGIADHSFKCYQPLQKTCCFLQGCKELLFTMEKGI